LRTYETKTNRTYHLELEFLSFRTRLLTSIIQYPTSAFDPFKPDYYVNFNNVNQARISYLI